MLEPEPHLLGDLLADGYLIARDHLHPNSHLFGRIEGRLRVFPRWVIERENGQELPSALRVGLGDTQSTIAPCGKLVDRLVHASANLVGIGRQRQNHLGMPLVTENVCPS